MRKAQRDADFAINDAGIEFTGGDTSAGKLDAVPDLLLPNGPRQLKKEGRRCLVPALAGNAGRGAAAVDEIGVDVGRVDEGLVRSLHVHVAALGCEILGDAGQTESS